MKYTKIYINYYEKYLKYKLKYLTLKLYLFNNTKQYVSEASNYINQAEQIGGKLENKIIKGELYNDLHPKQSLKNTGFKNRIVALNTIKLIKKRSLRYQFDIVNTMYNRAKYHPNKTNDMSEAMKIFKLWLDKYELKKQKIDKKYKWLTDEQIIKYDKIISKYKFDDITIQFYKAIINIKSKHKLNYLLINKSDPSYYDYVSYRIIMIDKLNKLKNKYKLFKKNNEPTKYHLMMIMYGYSLVPNQI